MTNSAVAAALRFLKEAAANLADASTAIADTDRQASATIDQLTQAVSNEIKRLEPLLPEKN